MRDRAVAGELQVELRRQTENNSDLLHKSNTPSYLFALVFMVPWGLASFWAINRVIDGASSLLLPIALGIGGPLAGAWIMKNAHRFLRPLATLKRLVAVRQLPAALVARYRAALPRLSDAALKGTLARLFERALVIHTAATQGRPHVQMLLEETSEGCLRLAESAIAVALEAQEALDRHTQAGEAELAQQLEVLRSRYALAPKDVQLAAALAEKEKALLAIAELEQAHLRASHRLLKAASALEVVAVQALLAHAPTPTGVSVELRRVLEEADFAGTAARQISKETLAG